MSSEAMCEAKDPAIKLFGKIIPVPKSDFPAILHRKSDADSQIPVGSDPKVYIFLYINIVGVFTHLVDILCFFFCAFTLIS